MGYTPLSNICSTSPNRDAQEGDDEVDGEVELEEGNDAMLRCEQ